VGSESDHPLRHWIQDVTGGPPRPVTPEGVEGQFVTMNQSDYVAARDPSRTLRLFPIDGGDPKPVKGATDNDRVIGGSAQADVLYVARATSAISMPVFKLNVANGRREPFVTVAPANPTGAVAIFDPRFTANEKWYIYNEVRDLTTLYSATGLK